MNLVRWTPFGEISFLQNQMNRLFDSARQGWPAESANGPINWSPAAGVHESDNELVVHIDLPGVDPKMVDVRVENNILSIRGERRFEGKNEKETFHRVERPHGVFARSFRLANAVDAAKISATYDNGVLTITLPKATNEKPKRIDIAAAAAA